MHKRPSGLSLTVARRIVANNDLDAAIALCRPNVIALAAAGYRDPREDVVAHRVLARFIDGCAALAAR